MFIERWKVSYTCLKNWVIWIFFDEEKIFKNPPRSSKNSKDSSKIVGDNDTMNYFEK